jgi:hypothetical protein
MIIFAPALALAAANAPLEQARGRADELDYAGALKLLDAALEVPGNERAQLLEIYELQGVSWATVGKADKARTAFRALLVLDPSHALAGAQPPRVKTPFYEAKDWVTRAGALTLEGVPVKSGDTVGALTVKVPKDGLGLARALSVHVDVNGTRRDEQVALDDAVRSATIKVDSKNYNWWAEVLGDHEAVLLRSGSVETPNVVEAPKVADAPVAPVMVPAVKDAPPPVGAGQRVAGALIGGAGVVALGVGAVLGGLSADARGQIANAARDDQGNVIGITQRRASELDAQARDFGLAANFLMIGGAVVAATGLVLVIFAPSEAVRVAPTVGGATVSGRF